MEQAYAVPLWHVIAAWIGVGFISLVIAFVVIEMFLSIAFPVLAHDLFGCEGETVSRGRGWELHLPCPVCAARRASLKGSGR
jgi:hypothetical protein